MRLHLVLTMFLLAGMFVSATLGWWIVALVLALAAVVVGRWSFGSAGDRS